MIQTLLRGAQKEDQIQWTEPPADAGKKMTTQGSEQSELTLKFALIWAESWTWDLERFIYKLFCFPESEVLTLPLETTKTKLSSMKISHFCKPLICTQQSISQTLPLRTEQNQNCLKWKQFKACTKMVLGDKGVMMIPHTYKQLLFHSFENIWQLEWVFTTWAHS